MAEPSNNRALVFLPALFLKRGSAERDREEVVQAVRALLADGRFDVNGRRPRVRGFVAEHQKLMNRRLAKGHQLVRRIGSSCDISIDKFKVQPAGADVELWWLSDRPCRICVMNAAEQLVHVLHLATVSESLNESLITKLWTEVCQGS